MLGLGDVKIESQLREKSLIYLVVLSLEGHAGLYARFVISDPPAASQWMPRWGAYDRKTRASH
jgi:hypothetical protein